ncbi:MAG: cytochrome b N-terminal domain-containing protein [Deltaproteobacteria bacterium]|nr:cytochrome b N-terminal domain-containing protein [Deltaproteobacteria bacterium]
MDELKQSGFDKYKENIKSLKKSFISSYLRGGRPTSDRSRAAVIVNNFFLHVQGARTHLNTLRPTYTFGLGLISLYLFLITIVSGVLLMLYYNPSVEHAYNSVKDINYVVFGGRLLRNIHKWAGEGMIIFVMLHMARVFYTSSYKKGREFNWVIGIVLLMLTFVLNYTGYLLPWDQLAYWALVIGANIAQSPKEITDILGVTGFFDIGGIQKELLLGGVTPSGVTLIRVYFLHIMLLPLILFIFLGVHFWRIRKDGGITVSEMFEPKKRGGGDPSTQGKNGETFAAGKTYGLMSLARDKTPAVDKDMENTVMSWPHLLRAEVAVFMLCLAGVVIYSFYINAPLKELANPFIPENPAKAPWYFLGLQELVSYSAFMGGVAIPAVALLSLALIPYLDREPEFVGIWFSNSQGRFVTLTSFILGAVALIGILAIVINFGWFRNWWPDIPQVIIILVNPGTIWIGFVLVWSILVIRKTGSTRMGAIAVFTVFLISYVIFTYVGTELRGPNWDFYWSKSQWPIH